MHFLKTATRVVETPTVGESAGSSPATPLVETTRLADTPGFSGFSGFSGVCAKGFLVRR